MSKEVSEFDLTAGTNGRIATAHGHGRAGDYYPLLGKGRLPSLHPLNPPLQQMISRKNIGDKNSDYRSGAKLYAVAGF